MRAVILVGGFGTRLRPLTLTTPKQLLAVLDVPMIERKIAQLVSQGVDDVVLSMGYKPDAFFEAFPDNKCGGARLTYVVEPQPLGTAGAIAYAAREAKVDSTFLAMNGDVLTDLDVGGLLSLHRASGAEGTLGLTPVDDPSRFGVVPTDVNGRVEAFIEKPAREDAPTNLINAGTYVLEPTFLDRIPEGREVSIEREVFPHVVSSGGLYAGRFSDYWLDIGTPDAYLQGNLDALDQDNNGNTFIGADAVNDGDAFRSVIGSGAQVARGATLHEAVILTGAVVEAGAVVEHSIVAESAHIGAGARVSGLSVVGASCEVAPNAVLDGEKVFPPE